MIIPYLSPDKQGYSYEPKTQIPNMDMVAILASKLKSFE